MHVAVTLQLAGFSARIREGTAVLALMLLLNFLLVLCSTVAVLPRVGTTAHGEGGLLNTKSLMSLSCPEGIQGEA